MLNHLQIFDLRLKVRFVNHHLIHLFVLLNYTNVVGYTRSYFTTREVAQSLCSSGKFGLKTRNLYCQRSMLIQST